MHTIYQLTFISLILKITIECKESDPRWLLYEEHDQDLELIDPQNRLFAGMACKGCEKIMDMIKDQLPKLRQAGKIPMMAAIRLACSLYTGGVVFLIPICAKIGEKVLDKIVDILLSPAKGVDPKSACKLTGVCPKC